MSNPAIAVWNTYRETRRKLTKLLSKHWLGNPNEDDQEEIRDLRFETQALLKTHLETGRQVDWDECRDNPDIVAFEDVKGDRVVIPRKDYLDCYPLRLRYDDGAAYCVRVHGGHQFYIKDWDFLS